MIASLSNGQQAHEHSRIVVSKYSVVGTMKSVILDCVLFPAFGEVTSDFAYESNGRDIIVVAKSITQVYTIE